MDTRLAMWVLLAVLVICWLPNTATAGCGPYFPHQAVSPWVYLTPNVYVDQRPPYFALFPPVYYSHPVRRPYVYSPCAYLPGRMPPKIKPRPPLVIRNPYVTRQPGAMPGLDRERRVPLRIINPHVVQLGDAGAPPGAVMPRQPQVVYPAATEGRGE